MSGRPEILFPLFGDLESLPGVGPKMAQNMGALGIEKPRDMLFHLPHAMIDRRPVSSVQGQQLPATLTVEVKVLSHRPPQRKGGPFRVFVEDEKTAFQIVFFHARGPWLEAQLPVGTQRIVSGKVELFDGEAQMVHPEFMVAPGDAGTLPEHEPVYPLAAGVTQKTLSKAAIAALARVPDLPEWADTELIKQEGWPTFGAAISDAHSPKSLADVVPTSKTRQRLAYDELLAHQITLALARAQERGAHGIASSGDGGLRQKVLTALPFAPTGAQVRAMEEIASDMALPRRMNRLLQGDVGAGKTLVAFAALLTAVEAGGQGVMMAPTEILARQHLEGLQPMAAQAGVRLEILTGRDKGPVRAEKLSDLQSGKIQILVGTHAVFQRDVLFGDLRLAIVDEQHRFGVRQRLELGEKGKGADVLVMTATPIPRSLALAQYGDMDVSVLDEKPPGRTPIKTAAIPSARIDDVISKLQAAVVEGKQCYWVCPLVEESETVDMTAAEERFKRLRAILGEGAVGLVHGQMPPADKDAAMARFVAGQTLILVATTVIEVGVNVPNATIMVIERAESFGLAQLHQLRGRVGRGDQASTCLLIYQPPLTEGGERRLRIMRETEDGFRIAEEDLAIRGAGDMIGTAQSGLPKFRVADLERQAGLMQIAQTDARKLLAEDPELNGPRGQAVRVLLWLMEQDRAIRLISVG